MAFPLEPRRVARVNMELNERMTLVEGDLDMLSVHLDRIDSRIGKLLGFAGTSAVSFVTAVILLLLDRVA